MEHDRITQMAAEAIDNRTAGERPTYEAARSVAREEEALRREALIARDPQDTSPLDPELFPPNIFNPDGSRKTYQDGSLRETPAEARAAFEWRDSRF